MEFTRRGGQHGMDGLPPGGLHRSHGDATERAGGRESTRELRGNDTSFIARIRLIECGIEVDKSSRFSVGHALLESFGDPGIIIFHDELGDLRSFTRGKGFKLLDDFSGAHGENNNASA